MKTRISKVVLSEIPETEQATCRVFYSSGQTRVWKLKTVCGCLSEMDSPIPYTVRQFCYEHKDIAEYKEHGGFNPFKSWTFRI